MEGVSNLDYLTAKLDTFFIGMVLLDLGEPQNTLENIFDFLQLCQSFFLDSKNEIKIENINSLEKIN